MNKLVLCVFIIWKYTQKIEEKEKLNNKKKNERYANQHKKRFNIFLKYK